MIGFVAALPFGGYFFARLVAKWTGLPSAMPEIRQGPRLAAKWSLILLVVSFGILVTSGILIRYLGLLDGPG